MLRVIDHIPHCPFNWEARRLKAMQLHVRADRNRVPMGEASMIVNLLGGGYFLISYDQLYALLLSRVPELVLYETIEVLLNNPEPRRWQFTGMCPGALRLCNTQQVCSHSIPLHRR